MFSGGRDSRPTTVVATFGYGPDRQVEVQYSDVRVIGNGSFGAVYQTQLISPGPVEKVAIKQVLQDKRFENQELQIMRELEHRNICRLKYFFYSSGEKKDELYLNLILEYISVTVYRIARHYSKRKELIPMPDVKLFMYQMFRALEYIHTLGICHGNIKPQNLLVDPKTAVLKLCDFGSAKRLVRGVPNESCIFRHYSAPELMFGSTDYTTNIDVWSAGCVLAELMLGQPIFRGPSLVDQMVQIIKVLGTPTRDQIHQMNPNYGFKLPQVEAHPWQKVFRPQTPSDAIDLVSGLLAYSSTTRLSPLQACAHTFFDEFREPNARLPTPLFNFTDQGPFPLSRLSNELVILVLSKLNLKDAATCRLVNRHFCHVVDNTPRSHLEIQDLFSACWDAKTLGKLVQWVGPQLRTLAWTKGILLDNWDWTLQMLTLVESHCPRLMKLTFQSKFVNFHDWQTVSNFSFWDRLVELNVYSCNRENKLIDETEKQMTFPVWMLSRMRSLRRLKAVVSWDGTDEPDDSTMLAYLNLLAKLDYVQQINSNFLVRVAQAVSRTGGRKYDDPHCVGVIKGFSNTVHLHLVHGKLSQEINRIILRILPNAMNFSVTLGTSESENTCLLPLLDKVKCVYLTASNVDESLVDQSSAAMLLKFNGLEEIMVMNIDVSNNPWLLASLSKISNVILIKNWAIARKLRCSGNIWHYHACIV